MDSKRKIATFSVNTFSNHLLLHIHQIVTVIFLQKIKKCAIHSCVRKRKMGSKAILFLCLSAVVLMVMSEVTARDLVESKIFIQPLSFFSFLNPCIFFANYRLICITFSNTNFLFSSWLDFARGH